MRTWIVITILICGCAAAVSADIQPVALTNRAVGGGDFNAYTHGVTGGQGLNNIGLLIRSWGKVTSVNQSQQYFCIDDGSDPLHVGLRVSYANLATGNSITPPDISLHSKYVIVTGISSAADAGGGVIISVLRPRRQTDIVEFTLP